MLGERMGVAFCKYLFLDACMTFRVFPTYLCSLSNSTLDGNSSSKTTGHMTGIFFFYQPYFKRQTFQMCLSASVIFVFFYLTVFSHLDLCSDEADNSPLLQPHTLKQFEQVRPFAFPVIHVNVFKSSGKCKCALLCMRNNIFGTKRGRGRNKGETRCSLDWNYHQKHI